MPSRSAIEAENRRQESAGDGKYLTQGLYFFELIFPTAAMQNGGSGETGSYMVPVAIPPEYIQRTSEYTVEKTYTAGGAGFVEENGVVFRELLIRGTTGWRPQYGHAGPQAVPRAVPKSTNGMYRPRELADTSFVGQLSGLRHFQFLEDKIFNTYSELKRNPSFAGLTELRWHSTKDDEHWRVIPESFRLTRDVRRKNLYQYEIRLTVVGATDARTLRRNTAELSGLAKLVSDIDNAVKKVRAALSYASALISDLTTVVQDISRSVRGAARLLSQAASVVEQVKNGLIDFVSLPFTAVSTLVRSLEDIASQIASTPIDIAEGVAAQYRAIGDAFDFMAVSMAQIARRYRNSTNRERILSGRVRDRSAPLQAAMSASELAAAGAIPASAAVSEARLALYTQETQLVPKSVYSSPVLSGDTLPNIAARTLGDARRWRELALLNGLQHPYISASGVPGTLTVGSPILIPSANAPAELDSPPGIISVSPDASNEERLLGKDLLLVEKPDGTFDLEADPATGKTDAKLVAGLANLEQALKVRTTTELGDDPLFRSLGYRRIVGTAFRSIDAEMVGIRLGEAISNDPRITSVTRLVVTQPVPDATVVDIDAAVRGFDAPIRSQVPTTAL